MDSTRKHRLSLALLLATASADAQIPAESFDIDYSAPLGEVLWLTPSDQVASIAAGDPTGDLMREVITTVNGRPYMFYGAGCYTGLIPVEDPQVPWVSTYDLAIARAAVAGQGGVIIAASNRGIERYHMTPSFTWEHAALADTGVWMGSRLVRTGDLYGAGLVDAIFVGSNRRSVGGMLDVATEHPSEAVELFVTESDILDMDICDFTGNGSLEVAILTTTRLEIRTPYGGFIEWYPGAASGAHMSIIRRPGTAANRVALVRTVNGDPYLTVYGAGGVEPSVALGASPVSNVAPGDFDGDGATDLFVSFRGSQTLKLFENTMGATESFSAAAMTLFTLDGAAPSSQADRAIVTLDLDNDHDLDLLVVREHDADIVAVCNRTITQSELRPKFLSFELDEIADTVDITFMRPAALGSEFNEFETLVWVETLSGHLEISPVYADLISVPSDTFEITIPDPATLGEAIPGSYYLVHRFLKRVGAIAIDASPPLIVVAVTGAGGSGGTTGTVDVPPLPCFVDPCNPTPPMVNPPPPAPPSPP